MDNTYSQTSTETQEAPDPNEYIPPPAFVSKPVCAQCGSEEFAAGCILCSWAIQNEVVYLNLNL